MISTLQLALALPTAFVLGGAATVAYTPSLLAPPAAVAPPPVLSPVAAPAAASSADLESLRRQILDLKDLVQQATEEAYRQAAANNVATVAIHNDLLRAEAERAAKRQQAASDARRLDFGPVIEQAKRATH